MTWGRDTDEHEAHDQLIAFAEKGGTLLDTAAGYGDGASEELIGTLIGEQRRRVGPRECDREIGDPDTFKWTPSECEAAHLDNKIV